MSDKQLRVVTFNYNPVAFGQVSDWIHKNNHKHVLAVTSPGPKSRPTPWYQQIVEQAPRNLEVLVTTRLKTVATPLIRALKPDLILCYSFAYRLSAELCAIPTIGAVNLHTAALPVYRGPNVFRAIYEEKAGIGATLHWITEEIDAGNILSMKSAPLPEVPTKEYVIPLWGSLISTAIDEGIARALAGERGDIQDETKAGYAAPFTEEEYSLSFDDSIRTLQRKEVALNFKQAGQAKLRVEDKIWSVLGIEALPDYVSDAPAGTCLEANTDSMIVKVRDGVVKFLIEEER